MKFIVTRYNISGCWYGRRRADTQVEPAELKAVLDGFNKWVNSVPHMTHTQILGTQPFKVYVKDSDAHGTDYAVGLWLSSTDASNNIYSISGDDPPNGNQRVDVTSFPDGNIPGSPAFFFVDAAHNALYAMRPEKIRINGKPQFDAAVRYFMARHGNVIPRGRRVDGNGTDVVELNMVGRDGETLRPKFESELQKNPTATDEILRRSGDIRKIIRVQDISRKPIVEKRSAISRLCEILGTNVSDDEIADSKRIKCEIDVRLTHDDVERLITGQSETADEKIAFKFKNDPKPMWADACIARKTVSIELDADGPQDVTARKLLAAIETNRRIVAE